MERHCLSTRFSPSNGSKVIVYGQQQYASYKIQYLQMNLNQTTSDTNDQKEYL